MRSHPHPGGLLEAVGREVQAGGQVPELRHRPAAQLGLREGGGHVVRRARAPQLGLDRELVVRAVCGLLDGPGQHGLAVVGQQPAEGVEVHTTQSGSRGNGTTLALAQVEC